MVHLDQPPAGGVAVGVQSPPPLRQLLPSGLPTPLSVPHSPSGDRRSSTAASGLPSLCPLMT